MFKFRSFKSKLPWILAVVSIFSLMLMGSTTASPFPDVIPLPNGFRPEGIALGNGSTFFAGSIPTGAIYRGDLRSGEGEVLVPAQAGHVSIGLKFDSRTGLLFVAGGPTGMAFVYDGNTGANIAAIQLTSNTNTFINDVVITRNAAYFTDSAQAMLYRVPLNNKGELLDPAESEDLPLGGDFQLVTGFNANGIDATPDGKTLFIVNSALGALYKVDPNSGYATQIDLDGGSVLNGDGILLQGKTLYVVQNFLNQIAVVELNSSLDKGSIQDPITSSLFRIPTTIAGFQQSLYAINARFDTNPTPDTEYEVVRVQIR